MVPTCSFYTSIQAKQAKTELIGKSGRKDYPRVLGKYFIRTKGTYKNLYDELLWMRQNYSDEYILQKGQHARINTENDYLGLKTI